MRHRSARELERLSHQHPQSGLESEILIIRGGFTDYLRKRGYAGCTVDQYQRTLIRVAAWLHDHPRHPPLNELTRRTVTRLLRLVLPGRHIETKLNYRKALVHWLKFRGKDTQPIGHPWGVWLSDYLHFLLTHQGVSRSTLDLNEAAAKAFMQWQFGKGESDWSKVSPRDIWCFARHYVRGIQPISAKSGLGYLRRFLRFVHLRGACGAELARAIPKVAVRRSASSRPEILSDQQRRQLLACFARTSPQGKRDYAMVLAMLDLGLRCGEVIGLRLPDVDWKERQWRIRVTKTGRGRLLPLPTRVFNAVQDYVKSARPQIDSIDHLFVRHIRRCGHPLTRSALKGIVSRAYRRCGFPTSWSGTHRLRHTFASRLHRRGVDMKPIADLLGHRQLDSTNTYTQVDSRALRVLARRWPSGK